jgi:hypothetical protein
MVCTNVVKGRDIKVMAIELILILHFYCIFFFHVVVVVMKIQINY